MIQVPPASGAESSTVESKREASLIDSGVATEARESRIGHQGSHEDGPSRRVVKRPHGASALCHGRYWARTRIPLRRRRTPPAVIAGHEWPSAAERPFSGQSSPANGHQPMTPKLARVWHELGLIRRSCRHRPDRQAHPLQRELEGGPAHLRQDRLDLYVL